MNAPACNLLHACTLSRDCPLARQKRKKKDPAKATKFKAELPAGPTAVLSPAPERPVRLGVLDEHRYDL